MILLKNLLKCDVAHQFFQPMLYPQKRSEFFISDHLQKVFQILAEPFSAYRVKIISNRESPGRSYSYAGYYF